MALLYADSCRRAPGLTGFYVQYGSNTTSASSSPRVTGGSYYAVADNYHNLVTVPLVTPGVTTMIAGWGSNGGNAGPGFYVSSATSSVLGSVWFSGSPGTVMTAYAGNYSVNFGSSTKVIPSGWNYWEAKVFIHATLGTVEVRLNGETFLSAINQNTAYYGSTVNAFGWGIGDGSVSWPNITDLYVCDASGSYNNDFLGDVRIDSIYPNAVGTSNQWTRGGTDSGANWSQIDEAGTPNDDTDYNMTLSVGYRDLLNYGSLATSSGTVKSIQHLVRCRKDDAGSRAIRLLHKGTGSATYTGSSKYLGTSYVYVRDIIETNPDDSQPWDISDVNAAEFGYELTV